MKKGGSRTYEYELSKEYPYTEAEVMSFRDAVDGFLDAWGVKKSSKNRRIVLEGALEIARDRDSGVPADEVFDSP